MLVNCLIQLAPPPWQALSQHKQQSPLLTVVCCFWGVREQSNRLIHRHTIVFREWLRIRETLYVSYVCSIIICSIFRSNMSHISTRMEKSSSPSRSPSTDVGMRSKDSSNLAPPSSPSNTSRVSSRSSSRSSSVQVISSDEEALIMQEDNNIIKVRH